MIPLYFFSNMKSLIIRNILCTKRSLRDIELEPSIVLTCAVIRYIPQGRDLQSYLSDTLHLKRILLVLEKLSFQKVKYLENVSHCVVEK
jgi:hypothetical protein